MAKIASYVEVIECLAVGFGTVSGREEKLTAMNSYLGKQTRYQHTGHGTHSGLLPDLIATLAGSDKMLAKELKAILSGYESLLAILHSRALFTTRSQNYVTTCFLVTWVYPQVAAFLHIFQEKFPSDSPLHYFAKLLPTSDNTDYDPVTVLKRALKAMIPEDIDATLFRTAIDKLNSNSNRKFSSISTDIKTLKNCFPERDVVRAESIVKKMQALYIAGIAVQRFAKMDANLSYKGKRYLNCVCEDMKLLVDSSADPSSVSFEKCHVDLLNLIRRGVVDGAELTDALKQSCTYLTHFLALQDPEKEALLSEIGSLIFAQMPINAVQIRQKLEAFSKSESFVLFRPIGELYAGQLALVECDLETANERFLAVVESAQQKQLGGIAFWAAGHAIALRLLLEKKIPNGSLEPLVAVRIESAAQETTFKIGHPTPFCSFDALVDLDISKLTIFSAVRDFNEWCEATNNPNTCNLLARLDFMMGDYFKQRERGNSVRDAISKAFPKLTRKRTVFPMHSATPYYALKNIWFYLPQVFKSVAYGLSLNPALSRYLSMQNNEQREILCFLDNVAYTKDGAQTGLLDSAHPHK